MLPSDPSDPDPARRPDPRLPPGAGSSTAPDRSSSVAGVGLVHPGPPAYNRLASAETDRRSRDVLAAPPVLQRCAPGVPAWGRKYVRAASCAAGPAPRPERTHPGADYAAYRRVSPPVDSGPIAHTGEYSFPADRASRGRGYPRGW